MSLNESFFEVSTQVRKKNPDCYLASLYAPKKIRGDLLVLYAFDLEIHSISFRAKNLFPAEIRLRWWLDFLLDKNSFSSAMGFPLAAALLSIIRQNNLPLSIFLQFIEAHIHRLYANPPQSFHDIEHYAEETIGKILQLSSLILAPQEAVEKYDFFNPSCHALLMNRLLGRLSFDSQICSLIPLEILGGADVLLDSFLDRKDLFAENSLIAALLERGEYYNAKFLESASVMPFNLRPAFLPLAVFPENLKLIRRKRRKAFFETTVISPWKRNWLVLRKAVQGWR